MFTGDDQDAQTKKLKAAEYQAQRDSWKARRGATRSKFSGRWPYVKRADASAVSGEVGASSSSSSALANVICYKCNLPGHFKRDCKK